MELNTVFSGSTARFRATLEYLNASNVWTALTPTTLAVTIRVRKDGAIINSRDAAPLVPVADYVTAGALEFDLAIADNTIQGADLHEEKHEIIFAWTYGASQAGYLAHEFDVIKVGHQV